MTSPLDLTTLALCDAWLGNSNTDSDPKIAQEITRISNAVLAWLQGQTFVKQSRTEFYNGKNTMRLPLRHFPVLSVSSLFINGLPVPANPTPPTGAGYMLDAWDGNVPGRLQFLSVQGYGFFRGSQNIQVAYTTGYVNTETWTVPGGGTPSITPVSPNGLLVADAGVAYADGTPLVAVASSPAVGQYVAPNPLAASSPTSSYQFNTGDANAGISISYSFVPWAVESVVKDLVGERWNYKARIGLKSKSLGAQETMAYEINDVPDYAKRMLQPFKNEFPM